MTKRSEQKEATRAALVQAALRCFEQRGYAGVQVSDITDAAGVAKGTFYVHFETKDQILDAILVDFNEALVAALMPVWSERAQRGARATLERVADVFLDHWQANRAFVRAYAERTAVGINLEALQFGINPPMQVFLRAALSEGAKRRGYTDTTMELLIQALLAAWMRLGLQALFNPAASRRAVRQALMEITEALLLRIAPELLQDR